jgi:hypothetical protein
VSWAGRAVEASVAAGVSEGVPDRSSYTTLQQDPRSARRYIRLTKLDDLLLLAWAGLRVTGGRSSVKCLVEPTMLWCIAAIEATMWG